MEQEEWDIFVVDEVLVAGDKAGQWDSWYRQAIPLAEQRYEIYLKERAQQEGGRR